MRSASSSTLCEVCAVEKVELKVTMEPERLDALRYFLSAKEKSTPQKELERALEGLYEKYVPAEMREYLDSKCRPAAARPRPRRTSRSGQAARPPHSETVEPGQDFGPEVLE